jgi:hypothetical protein
MKWPCCFFAAKIPLIPLRTILMRFIINQISLAAVLLLTSHTVLGQATQEVITTKHAITLPLSEKSRSHEILLPERGDSKEQVESTFGMPDTKQKPRGNPPISRWNYSSFTVFFEYNHVIHSTAKE